MKTDDLISLLSMGVAPVDARLAARRFLAALAVGTLISVVLTAGWYLLGMLMPTTVGALLGPRLLRW